jgi:hypothetical protein
MLETSHGFVPWDDAHHPELSMTDGVPDGRWIFINGNNTPRVARIDLTTFETDGDPRDPQLRGQPRLAVHHAELRLRRRHDALQRADPQPGHVDRRSTAATSRAR